MIFLNLSLPVIVLAADGSSPDQDAKKSLDLFPWHMPEDSILKNCYAGAGVGGMKSNSPQTNDDGSVGGDYDRDETSFANGYFFGYEFNKYFGVEAGYYNLGTSTFNAVSTGGPSWSAGPVSAEHEAEGGSLSAVVRYPLNERLSLIGTVGMFWWVSKETFVENGITTEEKESGGSATFSGGIEYDVGVKDRFVWRAEVHQFLVDESNYDITQGTFSVVYKFP
jgi:OOP family OmpA-OmpF porin